MVNGSEGPIVYYCDTLSNSAGCHKLMPFYILLTITTASQSSGDAMGAPGGSLHHWAVVWVFRTGGILGLGEGSVWRMIGLEESAPLDYIFHMLFDCICPSPLDHIFCLGLQSPTHSPLSAGKRAHTELGRTKATDLATKATE